MDTEGARGRPGPATPRYRRILLVGFMGSGKTTVGTLLAGRLGWDFLDFDREIERRAGATVREIFEVGGEAFFRRLEAEVARGLLRADRAVIASGGGWAAVPGRLEGVGPDTLTVWLRVDAGTAVGRAREQGASRPLLDVDDPVSAARTLLQARSPHYGRAILHLGGRDESPTALVEAILEHLEVGAGEPPPR